MILIKKLIYYVLIIVTFFISVFSLMGIFGDLSWFLDLFSHFKHQYLALLSSCLLLFAILRKTKASVITFLFLFYLLVDVLPLYIPKKNEETDKTIKINSINLLSSNDEFEKVTNYIKGENPDIVVLQELTELWGIVLDSSLEGYSSRLVIPRDDNFGIGIYSKIPLVKEQTLLLSDARVPSILANISIGKETVSILATHPIPPIGRFEFETRNEQFFEIIKVRNSIQNPFILIGDLNTTSYSPNFKRLINETDLRDSRIGFGNLPTWPASFSLMAIGIDHCLISEEIKVTNRTIGNDVGSDHLPIGVELGF